MDEESGDFEVKRKIRQDASLARLAGYFVIKTLCADTPAAQSVFKVKVVYKLSNGINSFGKTCNLAGSIVLVIYSLAGSHLDLLGSGLQCSLSSSLVSGSGSSLNLLNRGLNLGANRLVSRSLRLVY